METTVIFLFMVRDDKSLGMEVAMSKPAMYAQKAIYDSKGFPYVMWRGFGKGVSKKGATEAAVEELKDKVKANPNMFDHLPQNNEDRKLLDKFLKEFLGNFP